MKNNELRINSIDHFFIKKINIETYYKYTLINNVYYYTKKLAYRFQNELDVNVNFLIKNFSDSKINYEYCLLFNGNDTVWKSLNNPFVSLSNLRPNKYKILFRAKDELGNLSNTSVVSLTILPLFYQTKLFIIATILISLILLTLLIRYYLTKNEKKTIELYNNKINLLKLEFKALNALMSPHFIFNSLNSIQSFIKNKKLNEANDYLLVFSDMVRKNMSNINSDQITLEKEMDLVDSYLKIEKLRFNGKFDYKIIIDKDTDLSEHFLPPLIIQPLVENSIKHGLFELTDRDGYLEINIKEQDNNLLIRVLDNGIGFGNSTNKNGNNMALNNIKERLNYFSKINNLKYKIKTSSNIPYGVVVEIILYYI